jgi:regulator of RNase E activity RraA
VATATLSSQLRRRGLNNVSIDGLSSTRPDRTVVGTARTLRYVPNREDLFAAHGGGFNAQKRAIDTVGEGEILVMEARGEKGTGTVGDILALRAQVRGAAAIITDGGVRDLTAVAALDMPTYFSNAHPAVLGRRHIPWDTDITISCGGTTVQPGTSSSPTPTASSSCRRASRRRSPMTPSRRNARRPSSRRGSPKASASTGSIPSTPGGGRSSRPRTPGSDRSGGTHQQVGGGLPSHQGRYHRGRFGPGHRLVLARLAQELGVSVVPVREAIRRLEAEGFVTFERNVGAAVAGIDPVEYQHTMQTLSIIEGAATALAAPLLPPDALARARTLNGQMAECLRDFDPVRFTELNRSFHGSSSNPVPIRTS